MSSDNVCQSQFQLEEFTSSTESSLLYYQILQMSGSVYIWVGTEAGEQGSVVAAIAPRLSSGLGGCPTATLVGGANQDMGAACASRLQSKLQYPVILSLNIPEDLLLLSHIENTLVKRLT